MQAVNRKVGNRTGQAFYGHDGRVEAWYDANLSFRRTPSGTRIVAVERPDHSRVIVMPGGGWVQRPFFFRGSEYVRRTYAFRSATFDRFYRQSAYHGIALNVYAPVRYYPASFYTWAYRPWRRPVAFEWGLPVRTGLAAYASAFQPYGFYGGPSPWLADFLVANSLQAAYQQSYPDAGPAEPGGGDGSSISQAGLGQGGSGGAPGVDQGNGTIQPVPSYVKTQLAQEVQRRTLELAQETQAGRLASRNVGDILSDGQAHTFIAGSEAVVVDTTGTECSITAGDLVQSMPPAPLPRALAVDVRVLWGKGSLHECTAGARVTVSIQDLQEMDNHMRATVDQGFEKLRTEQATGTIPTLPPDAAGNPVQIDFANGAPAPERNVQADLDQQTREADQTERILSLR